MKKKYKAMEFITKYSESVKKGTFETNNKPSMTEPDNAMSIPEIIARFTRGQGIQVQQHPWMSGSAPEEGYHGDNDFSDVIPGYPSPQQPATLEPAPQEPDKEPAKEPVKASEGE